ncbi:MAG: hypothetical protein HYT38_01105 [Candidatus Sungbacteria bacterium]|uniref:Uncharacterized protein n=1 Tax=Candidatus Sungiibacteriota bacterium TaxID=2750080 RepID=A0A9D6DRR6_9BACT|nr:hypothetical protein [Candidatus Sungbacteria bacterium]
MAIAIIYNNTGKHGVRRETARAGKIASVPLDKMDPGAMENYITAFHDFFFQTDKEVVRKSGAELRRASLRLAAGQISLADAHAAARTSTRSVLEQRNLHTEVSDLLLGTKLSVETKAEKKDWLDDILEANPRKFLFVIVIVLVLTIITAAILGKSEIRKAGWAIALILIAFLVVNQIWKIAPTQQLANAAVSISAPTQRRIVVQIPPNNQLSNRVEVPRGWYFNIKRPGNISLVFDDGTVIKAPKGKPLNIGHPPSWGFRLKGDPGEAEMTVSPNKL